MAPEQDWGIVVLTNRASSDFFVQAVERYARELLFNIPHEQDNDLLAAEQEYRNQQSARLSMTTSVTAKDVSNYVGEYERGVNIFWKDNTLMSRTEFGEESALAIPKFPGAFLFVGNTRMADGGAAVFGRNESGNITVTLGIFDGESLELAQPVTLVKRRKQG